MDESLDGWDRTWGSLFRDELFSLSRHVVFWVYSVRGEKLSAHLSCMLQEALATPGTERLEQRNKHTSESKASGTSVPSTSFQSSSLFPLVSSASAQPQL